MVDYTPAWSLPHPAASDSVLPETRDFANLATAVASALTQAKGEAIEAWATKTAAVGQDANALPAEGDYGSVSGAAIANRPPGTEAGVLTEKRLSTAGGQPKMQTFLAFGTTPTLWSRFYGTSWSDWTRLDGADSLRSNGFLGADGDLDNATAPGTYGYWSTDAHVPGDLSGTVWVSPVNTENNIVQLAIEYGTQPGIYTRFRGTTGFSGWTRIDIGGLLSDSAIAPSATALKTLPVALSASTLGTTEVVTAGSVRFPLNVNAPITRWRLHIRNFNDRAAQPYLSGANFTGLWVGAAGAGGAFTATPTQIQGAFTLPADGTEVVTTWSNTPIGDGQEMLLSLGWTGATGPNTSSPAGAYRSTEPLGGPWVTGSHMTPTAYVPFSWWIEVETTATTPVVAMWGDSTTTGTGNDFILHQSPLSQYCRTIGAIPVHYSYPGTGMIAWTNANTHQWARWSHLSRVDAVIHFMGQNDLVGAGTLAGMQQRYNDTIENLKTHVSQNVYLATITPHAGKTEAINTVRKSYNTWLATLPGGARDVFGFSAAVQNATNDALLPAYDSGDTLHLSTAGSTALAGAVTRPVTTLPPDVNAAYAAYVAEISN